MSQTMAVFALTPTQQTYLEQQLHAVSRSFALVVPALELPLRYYLATAYLLCRVVDNIEDCGQPYAWQEQRFAEFLQLLDAPQQATEVLPVWEKEAWPALNEREKELMGVAGGQSLWAIYAQMPQAAREIVQRWTNAMTQGMRQLSAPDQQSFFVRRQGVKVIATAAGYDEYCYYVAGTVGHLATELVISHYQLADQTARALRPLAEACGRSLQKTNIVKDFAKDLSRAICYLPDGWLQAVAYTPLALQGAASAWKAMVLNDVLNELRASGEYLTALPYRAQGYRRASLMCLLPAYQTILLAAQQQEKLFTPQHQVKISRLTMAQCLADTQLMLSDNEAILRYSRRLEREIYAQFGR